MNSVDVDIFAIHATCSALLQQKKSVQKGATSLNDPYIEWCFCTRSCLLDAAM